MNPAAMLQQISVAIGQGDRPRALALAEAAWRSGHRHPLVAMLAAERIEQSGRPEEAVAMLHQAIAAAPEEPEPRRRLGLLLGRLGRLADSVDALEGALDLDCDNPVLLADAAAAHYRAANLDRAEDYHRQLLALQPGRAEPLAGLALVAVRRGDHGAARSWAEQALRLDPGNASARIAIARADLATGQAERALEQANGLVALATAPSEWRAGLLDLRAEALDALERPADAFADYQARNALLDGIYRPHLERSGRETRSDQADRLWRELASAPWPPSQAEAGAAPPRGHVFLIGFPRSGTTLVEKALAGHPAVISLPEIDCLVEGRAELLDRPDTIHRMLALDEATVQALRDAYWRRVAQAAGTAPAAGQTVLDKMPLNTVALPLIERLFPHARILFALRDPRDVVLSCFRRRFQINEAMWEFLELGRASRYYNRVMTLGTGFQARTALGWHEIRHEAVVADFETELRRMLAFMGLDWADGVADFAGRAGHAIRTPSDLQLTRGLRADGIGQWHRFADQLAPVLPALEPWVERFGYAR
jgi:tetratricopeptide (TPR) repeat protein